MKILICLLINFLSYSLVAADADQTQAKDKLRGLDEVQETFEQAFSAIQDVFQKMLKQENVVEEQLDLEILLSSTKLQLKQLSIDYLESRIDEIAKKLIDDKQLTWQEILEVEKEIGKLQREVLVVHVLHAAENPMLYPEYKIKDLSMICLMCSNIKKPNGDEISQVQVLLNKLLDEIRIDMPGKAFIINALMSFATMIRDKRFTRTTQDISNTLTVNSFNDLVPENFQTHRGGNRIRNMDDYVRLRDGSRNNLAPLNESLFKAAHKTINTMLPYLYNQGLPIYEPNKNERDEIATLFIYLRSLSPRYLENDFKRDPLEIELHSNTDDDDIYAISGTGILWSKYYETVSCSSGKYILRVRDLCAAFDEIFGTNLMRGGNFSTESVTQEVITAKHFETLGLAMNAPWEVVKQKYKELALKHHPDRRPVDESEKDKLDHQELFKTITKSYHVISEHYRTTGKRQ